jgi:hypothetical protein
VVVGPEVGVEVTMGEAVAVGETVAIAVGETVAIAVDVGVAVGVWVGVGRAGSYLIVSLGLPSGSPFSLEKKM